VVIAEPCLQLFQASHPDLRAGIETFDQPHVVPVILDAPAPRVKLIIRGISADAGHRPSGASIAPTDAGAYRADLRDAANSALHPRPRSLDLARDAKQQPIGIDVRHRAARAGQ
jgi:hypothetical protein